MFCEFLFCAERSAVYMNDSTNGVTVENRSFDSDGLKRDDGTVNNEVGGI